MRFVLSFHFPAPEDEITEKMFTHSLAFVAQIRQYLKEHETDPSASGIGGLNLAELRAQFQSNESELRNLEGDARCTPL